MDWAGRRSGDDMVAPRKRTPQMFMGAPTAPQATNPAGMFGAPLTRQEPKRNFDWASLLQGIGAGLLTGDNIGDGLGKGLILAREFGDQRADNERYDRRDQREEERYQYGLNQDQQAATQSAAEKAQRDAAIDALPIDPAMKAAMKASVVDYGDVVQKPDKGPAGVQEYEYAKSQGFTGTFLDYEKAKAAAGRAPVQGPGQTERQRNAEAAGLKPGTPEYTQFILGKDDTAPGPFQGTGLDAQSYNMVLTGDPTKPEYAAAYAQLAMPKVQFDAVTGKSVIVQPDMSWARKPGGVTEPPVKDDQAGVTKQTVPGATITSNQGAPVYNETQGKAAGFADRISAANSVLDSKAAAGTDQLQQGLSAIPDFLGGNYAISGDRQQFEQAERDFINAILRRESGAAIADSEFASARKQYIPQPGDDADTLAQKKASRDRALTGLQREGGPFYKPQGTGKKTVIDGFEIEELP